MIFASDSSNKSTQVNLPWGKLLKREESFKIWSEYSTMAAKKKHADGIRYLIGYVYTIPFESSTDLNLITTIT